MNTAVRFSTRPATIADTEFELALYASTRDDLRPLGTEVFDGLVGMQFRAQKMSIRVEHPHAENSIVTVDDIAVGRVVVDRAMKPIEVVDIALLPAVRGNGVGTSILQTVIVDAERQGRPIRLHIEKSNPAVRLYQRLGFVVSADAGMHWAMSRG
jgi:ribosomal protein S18 acetylase RimI-like enzyme